MLRRLATLVLLALVLACSGELPVTGGESQPKNERFDEGLNLLSLLRGTTIVDRSGEISFEFASMMAIDGHPTTSWSSPPRNLEQWLVAELPVRSRVDAVGLDLGTFASAPALPKELSFETSLDGIDWSAAGTFEFTTERGNQLHGIDPTEARFIRVTTLKTHGSHVVVHVPTLLAHGEELEVWTRPSVAGRWLLNDLEGEIREEGSRVYGKVAIDPPMIFDGAWNGRVIRFAWSRDRSYGVGLMTVSPDSKRLNGIWWYENAVDAGTELGNPWFGRRVGEPEEFDVAIPPIAQIHIERDGRYPMFGLLFRGDGELDGEASGPSIGFLRLALESFPQFRVRLEVAEYHSPDSNQNMAMSRRRAAGLRQALELQGLPIDRLVIVPIGSERPYPHVGGPLHWTMYSRVDFSFTASE